MSDSTASILDSSPMSAIVVSPALDSSSPTLPNNDPPPTSPTSSTSPASSASSASSSEDDDHVDESDSAESNHRCPVHGDDANCMQTPLAKGQRDEITAELLDPIEISFSDTAEALRNNTRGHSNMLPPFFYRTFYETSVTLSSRVSKDTHVKHRERQDLKIKKGNAFQAVGELILSRDLTKPRIERHLIWNKKRDPSSYISVFNALEHAKRRANFHYADSQRIGHRVSIAQISTAGLVVANLRANCRTTWKVYTKVELGETFVSTVTTRIVNIPIWVSANAVPKDGSSITADQLKQSGAELWMSITELRESDLVHQPHGHDRRRMMFSDGHHYEWLALGSIPESRIVRVMPWDGEKLHKKQGTGTVWSKSSPEPWIFDWKMEAWRLDPTLFFQAKFPGQYQASVQQRKRQRVDDVDDLRTKNSSGDAAPQALSISSIITVAHCYI